MALSSRHLNFTLPEELLHQLMTMVEDEQVSVSEMLRQCIRLRLIVRDIQQVEKATLILKDGDREQRILFI